MENSLNRRGFLRLCVVAAGGAVVAACQQAVQDIPTLTAVPSLTPNPITKINLTGADQDVWTWDKPIKVQVSGECQSIVVAVNGHEFEIQPEGETFTTDIEFSSGVNRIIAFCKQPNGVEIRSNMLNYMERLRLVPRAVINIVFDGERVILDASRSLLGDADGSKIIDHIWTAREGNPAALFVEGKPLTDEVSAQTVILQSPTTDG